MPKTGILSFFRVIRKHQVEIYVTIIFHLCLFILLLSVELHTGFYHNREEEVELTVEAFEDRPAEQIPEQESDFEREINSILAQSQREAARNIAVNEDLRNTATPQGRRSAVEDGAGRSSRMETVLRENEELQKRIAATQRMMAQEMVQGEEPLPASSDNAPQKTNRGETQKEQDLYAGPTVLSYQLTGRKAFYLPVPSYKCEKGGKVTVLIEVAQNGDVLNARIDNAQIVHECLQESARQAALQSKFNVGKEKKSQRGKIHYQFMPQKK